MGLFSRFTDIVNANINSMLDKAEDPEKMIKMIIAEMQETLVEVRSTAAKQIAEKKSLVREIREHQVAIENWQSKATHALTKDREDLAKAALVEKHKVQDVLSQLESQLAKLDEILMHIQDDAQQLQNKLTDAKRRRDALLLRQKSAQVRLKVREKAQTYNIDDAIAKFERYQQKIDNVEAQVEAYDLTADQSLESQFRDLESEENISQELASLKKKVANG